MLIALGSLPLAGRFSRYFLPQSDMPGEPVYRIDYAPSRRIAVCNSA